VAWSFVQEAELLHKWHTDDLTHSSRSARIHLNERIEQLTAPYAQLMERLDEITGIGRQTVQVVLA
jgi:hypothetical protein